MFETAGSLAIVQPVLTLVGLVALPLVWALLAAAGSWEAHRVNTGAELSGPITHVYSANLCM